MELFAAVLKKQRYSRFNFIFIAGVAGGREAITL
jgi:hypothetical protein